MDEPSFDAEMKPGSAGSIFLKLTRGAGNFESAFMNTLPLCSLS